MEQEEKVRLRAAFDAVTAGMDKLAVGLLLKRAAQDMPAALIEYEALAPLLKTHAFAVVVRGAETAFLTLPRRFDTDGKEVTHLLTGAVVRI